MKKLMLIALLGTTIGSAWGAARQEFDKAGLSVGDLWDKNKISLRLIANGKVSLELINQGLTSLDGLQKIPRIFRDLVTELHFSYNHISEIPCGVLQMFPNLRTLYLADNEIESLPASIFRNLPHLSALILSGNKIRFLPEGIFEGAPNLLELDMQRNPINTSAEGIFKNLKRLHAAWVPENLREQVKRELPHLKAEYSSGLLSTN